MSLNVEGCSCARCKAYLFSEDDVVYCPECGAPHHRECFSALGHCALESLHGTPEQYSREKELEAKEKIAEKERNAQKQEDFNREEEGTKTCRMCGEKYDINEKRCPNCSAPDFGGFQGFEAFDFLGGVPADYVIDENVTANDTKKFVLTNTHRFIPKFATLNKKNKVSWNWMAFLFPCGWLLSRKMYKNGIIAGILSIISSLLSIPLSLAVYNLGIGKELTYPEMVRTLYEALPQIGMTVVIAAMIGLFLDIAIRLFFGLFSDYNYKEYVVESIKKIKAESTDIESDYRKKGGANLLLFVLGFFIVEYLPQFFILLF